MTQKTQSPMQAAIYAILQRHDLVKTFEAAADFHLRLENKPYMPLVIERHDSEVSIAHYFTQNGDAMRDPELTFQLPDWRATSITQDPLAHYACVKDFPQGSRARAHLEADLTSFARTWARNIQAQGFVDSPNLVVSSLTHRIATDHQADESPAPAEDAHLEAEYESRSDYEDYEPSPYDGTYSEE